jgi:nicotinamidase-related amidase
MKPFFLPVLVGLSLLRSVAQATPPTLLEISGVPRHVPRLTDCVVLVIDAQLEYVTGRLPLYDVQTALRQTHRLLQRARVAGVPVIHIQQISKPGRGVFDPAGPYVAFSPEAAPLPHETILTKTLPNAFAGTTLDELLGRLGRKTIILSGYMTHMCVSATARSALDHGYRSIIIADGCATRDLPDGQGGTIAAETVHRVALAELADRFATVVASLDEIPD